MQYRKDTERAFQWLVDVLRKHDIPYQISGGMAAKIYGSTRPLVDIDVDIPDNRFEDIMPDVRKHLVLGPRVWTGEGFKVYLMTLDYHGQAIDIGGIDDTRVWHKAREAWVRLKTDLDAFEWKRVLGRRVRVIPLEELVAYKRMLDRRVDRKDLEQLAPEPKKKAAPVRRR